MKKKETLKGLFTAALAASSATSFASDTESTPVETSISFDQASAQSITCFSTAGIVDDILDAMFIDPVAQQVTCMSTVSGYTE